MTSTSRSVSFGRHRRDLWSLADDGTFLNHGSFGACPLAVQDEQQRLRREMEAQPDRFFADRIIPRDGETPLRAVATELGVRFGVTDDAIALVENATTGIQSVLESIALAPGDEILLTDHQYKAVRLAAEARCLRSGASVRIVSIPVPTTAEEIRSRIRASANPHIKLAIIDHITSASALIFPVQAIITDLHELGIPVLIDGAHALGQISIDLRDLRPEWYVSNAHKWLFAPRGSAVLYADQAVATLTRPTVTSHHIALGFPRSFDYIGTRDYTAWLALPEAIAFHERLEPSALRMYAAKLLDFASEQLIALGAQPVGPPELCGMMRSFLLPQRRAVAATDALEFVRTLWERDRMQIMSVVAFDSLVLRVSAQAYVEEADFVRLRYALDRHGWPGR